MSLPLVELDNILLHVLERMSGSSSLGSTGGLGGLLLMLVGERLEATLSSSQLGLRGGHTSSHGSVGLLCLVNLCSMGSLSELDVLAGLGLLDIRTSALHGVLHVVLRGLLGLELTGERLCELRDHGLMVLECLLSGSCLLAFEVLDLVHLGGGRGMGSGNLLGLSDLDIESSDTGLESVNLRLAAGVLGEALVPHGAIRVGGRLPKLGGLLRKKAAAAPRTLLLGLATAALAELAFLTLEPRRKLVGGTADGITDSAPFLGGLEVVFDGDGDSGSNDCCEKCDVDSLLHNGGGLACDENSQVSRMIPV